MSGQYSPYSDSETLLSIFAVPKPFIGPIEIIQRNAISSWLSLGPQVEVILLGNDAGTAEIARELGVKHIPAVERNQFNTPMVSSVFDIGQRASRGSVVAYVNADIILTQDILETIRLVPFQQFLISCRRWDLHVEAELDFASENWEGRLREVAYSRGRLHEPTGMDCFIFPKGMYRNLPPFVIGRAGWDSWLVYWTRENKIPVIDASKLMTIVHQNHDYSHHPSGVNGVYAGPEYEWNLRLAGSAFRMFTLEDADWLLDAEGPRRPATSGRTLWHRFSRLPAYYPFTTPMVKCALWLERHLGM